MQQNNKGIINMDYVTLINRSSKTLRGVWDGRHYDIAPGKHSFPEIMAMKFRDQNPIMGSEDPRTLQCDYLMGIEELSDDCSPIEQTLGPAAAQRIDRTKTPEKVIEVIQGNGLYSPAIDGSKPFVVGGPVETNFHKP